MTFKIKKVAVMGSGVMGSAIAAHFANAGIPSLLLDLPPKDGKDPNALAKAGLLNTVKAKPAAFYLPDLASLVEVGNFASDFEKIRECDLIVEVVVERMDIKKDLFKKIDAARKLGTVVVSNTSGLSINAMVAECSEDMRKHFLGMHFFNPPRYLKLLEIIPGKETLAEVIEFSRAFGEDILGKGTVICKDTPNFIANRIGIYAIMQAMRAVTEDGYSIQEVDSLMGPLIGNPKSAVFRTADVVGLDTMRHVSQNLWDNCPEDDEREIFKIPDMLNLLVNGGSLGAKTGKGFYAKEGKGEIKHWDIKSGAYVNKEKLAFASVSLARNEDTAAARIRIMLSSDDRASKFLWKNFSATFLYCAKRMGEISDSLVDIDNAMKWGFGWEIGPFGKWDLLGVPQTVAKMQAEGKIIPANIVRFLKDGNKSFYKNEKGVDFYYDFASNAYKPVVRNPRTILLSNLKRQNKVVATNPGASLIDLGDGIACLEFHTKMNAVGGDILTMARKAVEEVDKNFRGMVIANQGAHFSAGANIMFILMAIMEEEWEEIDFTIRQFQKMNMLFRYSAKPVVAAPFGMALGGGCEVCLHADQLVASAESYMGLVEVGVGLIPAGGGTKEMLLRGMDGAPDDAIALPFLKKIFQTIAMAKVSTSADEARNLGFIRSTDRIVLNGDHQIHYAKHAAIGLAESGYRQPRPRTDIPVMGSPGMEAVKLLVGGMKEGGYISEHDEVVSLKLAGILTGGHLTSPQKVSEDYLLELEREAFLSLCGMRKTQERIKHMLEKGKPLRN
jgi:3-hydroxyacyl-CoA dehydrogenase